MRLYLDDDIADPLLATLLRKVGHAVALPADAGMAGVSDPRHLAFAIQQKWVLLTRNHNDYWDLHRLVIAACGTHPGVLTVRSDNDPKRDMKPSRIVAAVAKLEASGVPLVNELHVLNHWR